MYPQAIPHFKTKRQSLAKTRPQSVVGLGIDNLSLSHIPDLLESPNISNREVRDENCDSITELPSTSLTLQHLVKSRPKRAKIRAPTRPLLSELSHSLGEGLETFFTKPDSETTLTPLVSPTSEECSSLSFVDSPTISREENIGGKSTRTSGETTPIMDERKVKLERQSPLLKGVSNWTPRSLSSDNLEKFSPLVGRKSPLVKAKTETREQHVNFDETTTVVYSNSSITVRDSGKQSPSNESIKNAYDKNHHGNGLKTPTMIQKPRPWSVLGHESKNEFSNDSNKTTPDALDNGKLIILFFSLN